MNTKQKQIFSRIPETDLVEIHIPIKLTSYTMSGIYAKYIGKYGINPIKGVRLNFSRTSIISPAGVTFLSNFSSFLEGKQVTQECFPVREPTPAVQFLDTAGFFTVHSGKRLYGGEVPAHILPLQRLANSDSHMWLRTTFVPWLAGILTVSEASLSELQASLSEAFNNIKDHSNAELGSIYSQVFPEKNQIHISLADFGRGIPNSVRRLLPNTSDVMAIHTAVREKFTTKTTPRNRGAGLAYLLQNIVLRFKGEVTIHSGHGIVTFRSSMGRLVAENFMGNSLCQGTLLEIVLPMSTIEDIGDEREDLEW